MIESKAIYQGELLATSQYPKAPINAAGEQMLAKGSQYFIDVGTDEDFVKAYKLLSKLPLTHIGVPLTSGRRGLLNQGHVMAQYQADAPIILPRSLLIHSGPWRLNPNHKPLNQIQTEIYGDMYDTPADFWEHLATSNPGLFDLAKKGAEGVAAAGSAVTTALKWGVAAAVLAVGLVVFIRVSQATKKAPELEPEEESIWT